MVERGPTLHAGPNLVQIIRREGQQQRQVGQAFRHPELQIERQRRFLVRELIEWNSEVAEGRAQCELVSRHAVQHPEVRGHRRGLCALELGVEQMHVGAVPNARPQRTRGPQGEGYIPSGEGASPLPLLISSLDGSSPVHEAEPSADRRPPSLHGLAVGERPRVDPRQVVEVGERWDSARGRAGNGRIVEHRVHVAVGHRRVGPAERGCAGRGVEPKKRKAGKRSAWLGHRGRRDQTAQQEGPNGEAETH